MEINGKQDDRRLQMSATGIGFAGIDGAWWLPATEPFRLPIAAHENLVAIGSAIFTLLNVVNQLYASATGERSGLNHLLTHKVPKHLLRFADRTPVYSLRPDFQLVAPAIHNSELATHLRMRTKRFTTHIPPSALRPPHSALRTPPTFSATELEICPSAQGYAHAMQVGYGLPTDLADAFAQFLDGRTLCFVGTHQWSEFIFEQLAFCRALEERGAHGRVLFDLPIDQLAASIRRGERWQPPIFGVKQKPAGWDDDLLGRLRRSGLADYLWMGDEWPVDLGEALIFRFGYLECFSDDHLQQLQQWQKRGATFLNPLSFLYESKALLAALHLPTVRQALTDRDPQALALLDAAIPETRLLTAQLVAEQPQWIIKFAGFDAGNQAWGGRSLQIGAQLSSQQWLAAVQHYCDLPFPTVAQRLTPSQPVDINYWASDGQEQRLTGGTTRLRTFFLRAANGKTAALGSHLTVSGGTLQVSEATDGVQVPVLFGDVVDASPESR